MEDQHQEQSASRHFVNFREQALGTGVRAMDDGRLDIEFDEHRPWISSFIQHMERHPEPIVEKPRPVAPVPEGEGTFPLRLNVVVQVVGSRGDIQPFIAMGKELKKHGHRVRLATHLAFRQDINHAGLEFFNIGGNPEELMAFMVQNPGLIPGIRTIRTGKVQQRRREMKDIFSGCWRSCFETGDGTDLHYTSETQSTGAMDYVMKPFVADVIIANPPCFAHLSCAEKMGIPLNIMFTMPWSPTQAFPHPLANIRSESTKPSVANFASYGIVEVMMWEGLGDLINRFRRRVLGLNPLDAVRAPSMVHRLRVPYTYLWSPALLPKPHDWPENIDVCGFQTLSSGSDYQPPADLENFIKAGDPPIYIGFGSIVVDDPERLTKILFEAVHQTGQRALISKGWGKIGSGVDHVPDNIFLVGNCPHDWLFRHVSCVVHHGGAGTTAAGLLLSRPTVIVPFFGDQPFWGHIVAQAGAGPMPVPYKRLTPDRLAAAIFQALEPQTREHAEEIGRNMRLETGVQNAVRSFHGHLDADNLRCFVCSDRPAVWWIRHSHIKLSTFAASILLHTGHIRSGDIILYRAQEYDTNRDPRGPLSAIAEVLYGVATDLIVTIVRIPTAIASIFPGSHQGLMQDEYKGREWAMQHFAECLSNQQNTEVHQGSVDTEHPTWSHVRNQGNAIAPTRSTKREGREEVPSEGSEGIHDETNMEQVEQELRDKDRGKTKQTLRETKYRMTRCAKHILVYTIVLPTDVTLSISKGFHNLPKLYHDRTVENVPKVIGIKSGFRAAKKELVKGFYQGVTGLVQQPVQGLRAEGGKGLLKGIGKGIGGAFFKPVAGICGLVGFPLDGFHKKLRRSLAKSKSKEIIRLRITQGIEEMCAASPEERSEVIQIWHQLCENRS
ncbi:hypothetical protein BDV24DRAFT_172028 [Aspergillus arachidicola]|uniref:Uncharacterized protein n=1 Tax=Aspergillus arachidicola TaxID=656916 RepID=A0A5N6XRG4_9EURO|nr:hypothetical protein BDV24DRAFT_172028 [Aspergillus arachidicola]